MAKNRARSLLEGYIERVSSEVFDAYQREITELIRHRHGIYALYKDDRLYYVGLASNLRGRVQQHLRDKHRERWNRFCLYLVRRQERLPELESLLIRIASPKGNRKRGRLPRAENLSRSLDQLAREAERRRREKLLGLDSSNRARRISVSRTMRRRTSLPGQSVPLSELAKGAFKIRARYKGNTTTARVDRDGYIRLEGKRFKSPSGAGVAVTKKPIDGWLFWEFLAPDGNWRKLDELRGRL